MLIKNLPKHRLFRSLFSRYILDVIAFKRALFTGKFTEAKAIFLAHLSLVKEMPNLFGKRCLNTNTPIELNRSDVDKRTHKRPFLIWEYFFKKKKFFSEIHK